MIALFERMRVQRQLRRCTSVGAGINVTGPLVVQNLGRIAIGNAVTLRSSPATSHLVTGPDGALTIGNGATLDHGFAIAAHERVSIGDGARIGPFAMLMDTDFHEAGKHDSAGGTGAIVIGAGARLGARVTVLRGSTIGEGAVVAAGSVVKGDVPAGAHVAGNPARPVSATMRSHDVREIDIDAVCEIVAYTFGLAERPDADTPRDAIEAWDSLGMLNLLLSLEESFDVSLGSDAMQQVTCIADLVPMLEAAAG